jgi:2-keto-4-pentenoate hydratase/2-oxohepta-3-ene-1,7-dioic acid hydratase in catechol pathway
MQSLGFPLSLTEHCPFCSEMIFDIRKIISFLSQGTTLERGTIIMTGTGPGIGVMRTPKVVLNHGDDIRVEIEQIGTLVNKVYYE